MSDPFERPVKVETLIANLQYELKGRNDARVTVSIIRRFLNIDSVGARRAQIRLMEDVFEGVG